MVVVLSLEGERYRHVALGIQSRLSLLKDLAVHIQTTIPHLLALLVIRLRGCAELVTEMLYALPSWMSTSGTKL